jgi:TonB family protein
MHLMRWLGPAVAALLTAWQINATAIAQVSGEILVGPRGSVLARPLAAVAPVPTEPGSEDPGSQDPGFTSQPAGSLTEPSPVLIPQPVYPRAARAARQEGRVMICFTVDERGRVQMPAVRASTDPVFNEPVLEAISASRFTPARFGEKAVRSTACRTFRFALR